MFSILPITSGFTACRIRSRQVLTTDTNLLRNVKSEDRHVSGRTHVAPAADPAHVARLAACGMPGEGRRKNSEGKGGGYFCSAVHQGPAGSEELGEESPGWPIKCLAVPRKLLPVSRGRSITPCQPAGKSVGATRYSRFVTCYPCPSSGCPALVARGPSGSTKKAARAPLPLN